MIGIGSAVVAYANSPHEFRGHVTSVEANVARVVGPARPGQRHREGRDFALRELAEVVEPPLTLSTGQPVRIYGHLAVVVGTGLDSFAALADIPRKSGVEFHRHWPRIPNWHLRTGR